MTVPEGGAPLIDVAIELVVTEVEQVEGLEPGELLQRGRRELV